MNLEEYKERTKEDENWAPGFEAIEDLFNKKYPQMEETQYGTYIKNRVQNGVDGFIDCFSIYESENGYKHIVTHGMSELYSNEDFFGSEYSGFGYEMTMKLQEDTIEECAWAIEMLSNFAHYTYENNSILKSMQFITGEDYSLNCDNECNITGVLVVNDTEIDTIDTVHGKVEFLQLVGLIEKETEIIKEDISKVETLIENMKRDNPYLITDKKRVQSYL